MEKSHDIFPVKNPSRYSFKKRERAFINQSKTDFKCVLLNLYYITKMKIRTQLCENKHEQSKINGKEKVLLFFKHSKSRFSNNVCTRPRSMCESKRENFCESRDQDLRPVKLQSVSEKVRYEGGNNLFKFSTPPIPYTVSLIYIRVTLPRRNQIFIQRGGKECVRKGALQSIRNKPTSNAKLIFMDARTSGRGLRCKKANERNEK